MNMSNTRNPKHIALQRLKIDLMPEDNKVRIAPIPCCSSTLLVKITHPGKQVSVFSPLSTTAIFL